MSGEFPQARPVGADTEYRMKSIVIVYAAHLSRYATESFLGGESTLVRSVRAASVLPFARGIAVFTDSTETLSLLSSPGIDIPFMSIVEPDWDARLLFARMAETAVGYEHVYFIHGDEPFHDAAFAQSLWDRHIKYAAEYTFADGYPVGLAPVLLAAGIIPALERLADPAIVPIPRDVIFETMKKDINSFDIETDIAPVDSRQLRVVLSCDTKRNAYQTAALAGINASNYPEILSERAESLYQYPSFYAIQVAGRCPYACVHCPYPAFSSSGIGNSPGIAVTERADFMNVDRFRGLIDKISEYSEDAVISLSLFGEPSYHPDVPALFEAVLAHPGLSLLVETTGIGWSDEVLDRIASVIGSASPRVHGKNPVEWIVSLDAIGENCYARVHGLPAPTTDDARAASPLREALRFVERSESRFPGHVWPQMVRMNDNEEELEAFYRFWNQKAGRVIVQKHDHFCKTIQDRRVADLSPLIRLPCWHLKRDMSILIDGTVPLCREDLYALGAAGNAFENSLEALRERLIPAYLRQCSGVYEGLCSACDEYYTFNF